MDMSKKMIAVALVLCMALSCATALADTVKHERVYAVTNADGTVVSLTDSVRLENADQSDTLTDSTMLTDIVNVGGDESFTLDGETITFEANGHDITYQGTSDKPLPVTPVVTVLLDGQQIEPSQLKDSAGSVEITVSFEQENEVPHLALTAMILPDNGITDLTLQNAVLVSLSDRQAVVGWAVPGADQALDLPTQFSLSFEADHADIGWMMTVASADPVQMACKEIDSRIDFDPHAELNDIVSLLTAMQNGEALPQTEGRTAGLSTKVNELNDGLTQLNDGAAELAAGAAEVSSGAQTVAGSTALLSEGASTLNEGAATLSEGAASLDTGLSTLSENSAALNDGADAIFAAVIDAANAQIASSGLADAGIELPALTIDNYSEVLTAAVAQLEPEAVQAQARAKAEPLVREQVEANEAQVREAVTEAVRGKVLEQVLAAAGMELDAASYAEAVSAGQVDDAVAAQIQGAVDQQMASEEVQALIDENVAQQIDQLVSDNVDQVIAEDQGVAAALATAQTAHDSLAGLLAQLDQVNTFVQGLKAYTAGVDQAAAGASELSTGASSLSSGASELSDGLSQLSTGADALSLGALSLSEGATALHDDGTDPLKTSITGAEKDLADQLLPVLNGDVTTALNVLDHARETSGQCGYDLRADGMEAVTVYIIRTDLK